MAGLIKRLMFVMLFSVSMNLQAKTVVLIHGFASGPGTWYKSGVMQMLNASGYADGGVLPLAPNWAASRAPDVAYAVRLPWWAPLEVQGRLLDRLLKPLYLQRREPVILIGHSTGGVVARLYSLSPENMRVPLAGVVTVASPNLGTPFAKMAWEMLRSPMGEMLDSMDEKSRRFFWAKRLLWQISSDEPNPIRWMMYARHPENVKYISIVHTRRWDLRRGDFGLIVPPKYQDLRSVPALSGRAVTIPVPAGHKLTRRDGWILADLLQRQF